MTVLAEPVSPELILVSPPEVAQIARTQLREFPFVATRTERAAGPGVVELVGVYAFFLLMTLGPLLFLIVAAPRRG